MCHASALESSLILSLLILSACETAKNTEAHGADQTEPQGANPAALDMGGGEGAGEAAADSGLEEESDQELVDMITELDGGLPTSELCERDQLIQRQLSAGSGLYSFGELAGDFTVQTLRGAWTLSEQWTGCESYVFLVYFPDLRQSPSGPWVGDQLWESEVSALLQTPANTHYFFISAEDDPEARQARMLEMNNRVVRSLNAGEQLPERRFHFVTDRLTEIEGSVGSFARDYLDFVFDPTSLVDLGERGQAQAPLPFVFGIDRLQRWDSGGSLDELVGQAMKFDMASYLGYFYNHIANTYERAKGDGALEVTLLEGRVSERVFIQNIELPEPSLISSFDTLEVDVSVTCPHRNVFACSEWDRIARIELCRDPECHDRDELARWITPYWRRGERRWIWDASASLAWLSAGGTRSFRVEMGPEAERATERDVSLKLRLRSRGAPLRVTDTQRAFVGGDLNESYNQRDPISFSPPADVTQVELVVLLSGHGQTAIDNCAEWCDHQHHFTVNGVELPTLRHEGSLGSLRGCAEAASEGVSPGQFGNWAPERAYWCPGLPITPIRVDITEYVRLGEQNEMSYRATLSSDIEPRGGKVALSSYIVYSR